MGLSCVVVVLGLFLVQGMWTQVLVDVMQDMEVREGQSVVLPCKFSSEPIDCLWTRGGSVIYPRFFKGTYDMAGSLSQGDCSLRIVRADFIEDNNLWFCQTPASSTAPSVQSPPARLVVLKFEGASAGAIAGIVIAALVVVIIIFLIGFCLYRHKMLCFAVSGNIDGGAEASLCLSDVENAALNNEKVQTPTIVVDDSHNGKLDGKGDTSNGKKQELVYAVLDLTRNNGGSPRTNGSSPRTNGNTGLPAQPRTAQPRTEYASILHEQK